MPDLHELAEHIEHAKHMDDHARGGGAAHGGGGHGGGGHGAHHGSSKGIGITMAVLGVMLAFCAAMVGAARTELIATMVEQSNKFSLYQAESMKYRVMEADVEMLHALTPSGAEVAKFERELKEVRRVSGKADDEDTQELKAAIELSTKEVADVLSPDPEDETHLTRLAKKYEHDMKEAKEDAECYDAKIGAHFAAAEWYERAQLCAEIGIVVASVALLLTSRLMWMASLVFGIGCSAIIARTYVHTSSELAAADAKIEEAQKRSSALEADEQEIVPDGAPRPEGATDTKGPPSRPPLAPAPHAP